MAKIIRLLLVLACWSFGLAGCDRDENVPPDATVLDSGATDAGIDDTDAGSDPCVGNDGCFACEPTTEPEILEACTDAQCEPFDNEARLPLYEGSDLPPLP